MTENNAIETSIKLGVKRVGLGAKLDEAKRQGIDPNAPTDVTKLEHRIGLVFDDSGSMFGSSILSAQRGVEAFVQTCSPITTAICLYPLNQEPRPLTTNMGLVMITSNALKATGGTPANRILQDMLEKEPITRAVIFTDGGFTDTYAYGDENNHNDERVANLDITIRKYKAKNVPVDTIYIGSGDHADMQRLSKETNGLYIKFENMEQLKKGLKYLAPAFRAMLTSGKDVLDKIKGE